MSGGMYNALDPLLHRLAVAERQKREAEDIIQACKEKLYPLMQMSEVAVAEGFGINVSLVAGRQQVAVHDVEALKATLGTAWEAMFKVDTAKVLNMKYGKPHLFGELIAQGIISLERSKPYLRVVEVTSEPTEPDARDGSVPVAPGGEAKPGDLR